MAHIRVQIGKSNSIDLIDDLIEELDLLQGLLRLLAHFQAVDEAFKSGRLVENCLDRLYLPQQVHIDRHDDLGEDELHENALIFQYVAQTFGDRLDHGV